MQSVVYCAAILKTGVVTFCIVSVKNASFKNQMLLQKWIFFGSVPVVSWPAACGLHPFRVISRNLDAVRGGDRGWNCFSNAGRDTRCGDSLHYSWWHRCQCIVVFMVTVITSRGKGNDCLKWNVDNLTQPATPYTSPLVWGPEGQQFVSIRKRWREETTWKKEDAQCWNNPDKSVSKM